MNNFIRNVSLFAFVFLVSCASLAQSNPDQKSFTLLPGEDFSFSFYSQGYVNPNYIFSHFDGNILGGDGVIQAPSYVGSNQYKISFTVSEDYLGKTSLYIKYYEGGGMWAEPRFMTLNFHVVESYIITRHDYKSILFGGDEVIVDVVSNDYTTHGPLTISGISLVQKGTAQIVDGSSISFSPEPGHKGMGYINYVVSNELGFTESGTVSICILDPNAVVDFDEIRIATTNKSPVSILLPADGFQIDVTEGPELGEATFIGSDVIEYIPAEGSSGEDVFTVFQSGMGLERRIVVHIIDTGEDKGSVKDDKVFTEVNHPVVFNVFSNDLSATDAITSHSNELENLGNGQFRYTPPAGYSGIKHFYYTTYNGFDYQTAEIKIYVNNYYPEALLRYELVTKKNTPLILNYNIPIDDYEFNALSNPSNGNLSVLSGIKTYDYNCGAETGLNMVVYQPSANFVGNDEFDIEYCIGDEQCRVIKVDISVVESDQCGCAGNDCVWSGDSDNDGKISIADLLPVGYHLGASGSVRTESDPTSWIAQFSGDWVENQAANGQNTKFIDANGDGLITAADTIGISMHYNQYHNLVAKEILSIKDYPFRIIPSTTDLSAGDLLELDIEIGSDQYPVIDLHGIAYTLTISSDFVDSSTVYVIHHDDWFGYNSPTIHMNKQPKDGKIDIGTTRTTGVPITGKGLIQTIGLIVEEDLDGFRKEGEIIELDINVKDIYYYDLFGEKFALPDVSTTINIIREPGIIAETEDADITLYPNPAFNELNIHLNGQDVIREIELFSMSGQKIHETGYINSDHFILSTNGLPEGLYIARIQTTQGSFTKKFKVSKT